MAALLVIFGLLLGGLFALAIYRVKFHPLAKYPGPRVAGISSVYGCYHSAKGDIHLDIQRCFDLYGPIVRYGPNRLVFSTPRALHDIYAFGTTCKKSSSYLTMVPWKDGWTVITCMDKTLHKSMRQTLQSGLSPASLRTFEEASLQNITMFIDLITESPVGSDVWSSPKDMTTLAKWLSIDSMSTLAFGKSIDLLKNPSIRYIVPIFDYYTWRTGFFEQWPRLWFTGIEDILACLRYFSPTARRFSAWRASYTSAAIDANSRTKMGVFSGLACSTMDNKTQYQYTRPQMEAEGSFILLVAGDSNATSVAAALFYLSRHPSIYSKLRDEIRSTFAAADEIRSGILLNRCPYLSAVIAEVLRIHPPSPGVPWREAGTDTVIDGTPVPAGVDVGCCLYALHHDQTLFCQPSRFWPERWIPGTLNEEELRKANLAYKPFSMGPRSCAGRAVAMNEIALILGRILYECDLRVAKGELGRVGEGDEGGVWGRRDKRLFQFETHFTAMTEGPWLEFRRRST